MNKYGSVVRTFIARNMVWNHALTQGAVPNGLFKLAPPAALVIDDSASGSTPPNPDLVMQFFDSTKLQQPEEGWLPLGNVFLKRMGLFSNFADGLVLENLEGRLSLNVVISTFSAVKMTGTIAFTKGSNLVTGTNFNADIIGTARNFVIAADTIFDLDLRNAFAIYKVDNTNARISNYAYNSYAGDTYFLTESVVRYITTLNAIDCLNNMVDVEMFFPAAVSVTGTNPYAYAYLSVDTTDSKFSLLTNTISDSFATTPASFDAAIELECTYI